MDTWARLTLALRILAVDPVGSRWGLSEAAGTALVMAAVLVCARGDGLVGRLAGGSRGRERDRRVRRDEA